MNRFLFYTVMLLVALIVPSCADHDDPQLAPIDTTQVKLNASVSVAPNSTWLTTGEELTIKVGDIEMAAPKGVVLRSISLVANNGTVRYDLDNKPYSGEPLEFKVPLTGVRGRVNFSLRGNLIKKNSRDAEILIADNIQKIVFSEEPKLECEGLLNVTVKSTSTTGEEYSRSFEVSSIDKFTIPVPQSELYWTPASGTASTIEVSLASSAEASSPNTTFDCAIVKTAIGASSGAPSTITMTLPNTPGSLNGANLKLYVITSYYGTWENVTIDPYNLTSVFDIIETE